MAEHTHHSCECKHGRVKFCAKCQVVHCLNCKQEWTFTPCNRAHYPYWPYVQPYYLDSGAGGTVQTSLTAQQVTDCEHVN